MTIRLLCLLSLLLAGFCFHTHQPSVRAHKAYQEKWSPENIRTYLSTHDFKTDSEITDMPFGEFVALFNKHLAESKARFILKVDYDSFSQIDFKKDDLVALKVRLKVPRSLKQLSMDIALRMVITQIGIADGADLVVEEGLVLVKYNSPRDAIQTKLQDGQKEAAQAVAYYQRKGGVVTFDDCKPGVAIGLDLGRSQVTNADLAQLKYLAALRCLELEGCPIDTDGLRHVRGLANLTELYLRNTKIDNPSCEHLSILGKLQTLDLSYTKITDAGLSQIKDIKSLKTLWLRNVNITDAGLGPLVKECPNLEVLVLGSKGITDDGLKHLSGLKSLKNLLLVDSTATADGIRTLRKALPDAEINVVGQ